MQNSFVSRLRWKSLITGACAALLCASPAWAQHRRNDAVYLSPPNCEMRVVPQDCAPQQGMPRMEMAPAPVQSPSTQAPTGPQVVPFDQFAALGGPTVALADPAGGYIDPASIRTRLRLRADAANGNVHPDRAEYFYAKCGCFRVLGIDPNAAGPGPNIDAGSLGHVDYRDYMAYLEYAFGENWSVFSEVGIRESNPVNNSNETGFADTRFGVKTYLSHNDSHNLTAQLKAYAPTGDSEKGLGTDHWSIEPGILFNTRLSDKVSLEAEIKDWISIGGSDFAGNVLQYGTGLGYDIYQDCDFRVTPIIEVVGWTVLDGQKLEASPGPVVESASGDTIINVKAGVRIGSDRQSMYVGYGRAVTGETWYDEIFRLEYRINF